MRILLALTTVAWFAGCTGEKMVQFPLSEFHRIVNAENRVFQEALTREARKELDAANLTGAIHAILQHEAPFEIEDEFQNGAVLTGRNRQFTVKYVEVDGRYRFAFPGTAEEWERWQIWFKDLIQRIDDAPPIPWRNQ